MEQENDLLINIEEKVEMPLKELTENGINVENVDYVYRLVDIYKDIKEIMQKEDEYMMYSRNPYGNDDYMRNPYGARRRDSQGRYMDNGMYARRGYDTKYRGADMVDNMYQGYVEYSDGKEMYGNDGKTMESYQYMLKSMKDFYKHLMSEASSEEEVQMLQQTIQEMANM